MPYYTIHYAGFDQTQQASIAAVLDLADSLLTHSWNIVDNNKTDIVMINMIDNKGQQLISEYKDVPDIGIIIVAGNSQPDFHNYWFLEKKQHAPPSLKKLADLLNEVGSQLQEVVKSEPSKSSNVSETTTSTLTKLESEEKHEPENNCDVEHLVQQIQKDIHKNESPIHDNRDNEHSDFIDNSHRSLSANNYFFGHLLKLRNEKKYYTIKLFNLPLIYIAAKENIYYYSGTGNELLRYSITPPRQLKHTILSRAKFNKALKAEDNKLRHNTLESLITFAIVNVTHGQLLTGHSTQQILSLDKSTAFKSIPLSDKYRLIADLMHQEELSLFDLIAKLPIPESNILDFYNIYFSLGYINIISSDTPVLVKKNSKTKKFIKTLFKNQ